MSASCIQQNNIQENIFEISESKVHKCGILYVYAKYYKNHKHDYIDLLKEYINNTIKLSNKYNKNECIFYVDLKDLKLKDYDTNFLKILIDLLQKDYPDTLEKLIIVNVPFFIKTIYGLIKRMIDHESRDKIFFEKKKKNGVSYTNNIEDFEDLTN